MFEVQILIPVQSNEGATFSSAHHAAFEAELLAAFGGFTRIPVEAVGAWKNAAGVRFDDETRLYAVALTSITRGGDVAAVVAFAKAHYAQEAVFIRYLGVVEIL
jgi:hypothetical protein